MLPSSARLKMETVVVTIHRITQRPDSEDASLYGVRNLDNPVAVLFRTALYRNFPAIVIPCTLVLKTWH
jgi:hypothetical protein